MDHSDLMRNAGDLQQQMKKCGITYTDDMAIKAGTCGLLYGQQESDLNNRIKYVLKTERKEIANYDVSVYDT